MLCPLLYLSLVVLSLVAYFALYYTLSDILLYSAFGTSQHCSVAPRAGVHSYVT